MKYFFLGLVFSVSSVFACEVILPKHLVILGDEQNIEGAIKSTNCAPSTLSELSLFLTQADGRLSPSQLTEFLEGKGERGVRISVDTLRVEQLKNILREKLTLPPGVHVKSLRPMNGSGFVVLGAGESIEASCDSCLFGSQQPINVRISTSGGDSRQLTVIADFKKMVRAFRTTGSLQSFADVSPTYLREEYVEMIPHTQLVTDLETLRFYKTNKPIHRGELLKLADLNAINLVRAGYKTEVVLENQMVRLKTSGISRSNGTLGEFVEVFHPQKNKKYQGRVVDVNKVLVEL